MAHRPSWRSIRINRNYTVAEAASVLGVARGTVRRWIASGRLSVIDTRKPALILGAELIGLGSRQRAPRQPCRLDQCYCFVCKAPKGAAFRQAEIVPSRGKSAMLRMLCETCATVMHKRVSWKRIGLLRALLCIPDQERVEHLIETAHPCENVHLEKED